MSIKRDTNTDFVVECTVCLAEIPSSSAKSEEASDYVMYFCGLDCYDKWKNRDKSKEKEIEAETDNNQP